MTILEDLLKSIQSDFPIRDVFVGAHWTAVISRGCGLAATIQGQHQHGMGQVRDAGRLHEKSALELAQYALSDNLLEASIGMAALNSLIEVDESAAVELNAAEVLAQKGRGKKVALVGHFPFVPKLAGQVGTLWVIEQQPAEGDYPAEAAPDLLPQADVVAITATAIINHTIEGLLPLCSPATLVMVLGPSTPLSPLLFEKGVTILSGARVIDETAMRRTVLQGASFRQMEGVKLINILRPGYGHAL